MQFLQRILGGRSDASVRFDDLRGLLRNLGFTERVRGSHYIFQKGRRFSMTTWLILGRPRPA